MILVVVGLWCFATAVLGGLVGLVLGNIRLPVIVLAASSPASGAGANIGISACAALASAISHIRAGRIDWGLFGWMAPPSMVGAVAGGLLSDRIPSTALLATIGVTLLLFGIDLLRSHAARPAVGPAGKPNVRAAVVAGALIGLLGGFVGLILGALRLPALLRFVGLEAFRVVGTNAAVGFCLGVAGVFGHLSGGVDWTLLGIGAATSVPGSILGATLTGRLDERQLLRAVGVVLLVAGSSLLVQAAV